MKSLILLSGLILAIFLSSKDLCQSAPDNRYLPTFEDERADFDKRSNLAMDEAEEQRMNPARAATWIPDVQRMNPAMDEAEEQRMNPAAKAYLADVKRLIPQLPPRWPPYY
uniref:Uncharacterized protein n=1 Tax=Isometrus maculatus TaxID=497827 RepID=A0A0U1SSL8_ISOMC|nr:hypothetical protein [Isometrus maculatus]